MTMTETITNTYEVVLGEHRLKNYWVKRCREGQQPYTFTSAMYKTYEKKRISFEATDWTDAHNKGRELAKRFPKYNSTSVVMKVQRIPDKPVPFKQRVESAAFGLLFVASFVGVMAIPYGFLLFPIAGVGAILFCGRKKQTN
jgi:hypothetical protein